MTASEARKLAAAPLAGTIVHLEHDPSEREALQRPLDFAIIRRLFGYTVPYGKKRNTLLFLVVLRATQVPMVSWGIGAVISGPIAHHDPRSTLVGAAAFSLLVLFTEAMFQYRIRLALELGEAVVHDLRNEVYAHLLEMPMSFFDRAKIGRLISRIVSDVDQVRIGVQDVAFIGTVQGGTMLIAAGLMIYYDWVLFLVVLAMVPILWKLLRYFRGKLSETHRKTHESFSRVTATLAESVIGVRVTQGFVRQDINGGLFRALIQDHSQNNMEAVQHSAVFLPLLEFNGQLFLSILLVVGGYQALHGHIGITALIQFFFLANLLFNPISVLGNQYNQALTAMAGAERVFKLLDTPPQWSDDPRARPLPAIRGEVAFHGVSFGYRADKMVLHDIDFVAKAGQIVALVGHTGSGKTSIVNLIAKFYLPTRGRVLIDGRDVTEITGRSLHHQMGVVLQNNFLFSGTVMDNVRVGRAGATDAEVIDAARRLDVLDLIEDLPQGFATMVGEKGTGLSLGQRQIVCFVRAMLADPRIMILDEATSSIDSITEARLSRALSTLLSGRTSFVIAHRLSTIRHADQVLVLDHGRIVERGKHATLLARGGVYAELYRQFVRSGEA
jgi:ATP-binding cassette subfamily B protein